MLVLDESFLYLVSKIFKILFVVFFFIFETRYATFFTLIFDNLYKKKSQDQLDLKYMYQDPIGANPQINDASNKF